jgi:cytosolic carboxypeptidase protein 2/3
VLRNDINTSGHAQWFYFSVRNLQKGGVYKLNLINLVKPGSLYVHGMQPLFHSKQRAAQMVRCTSFSRDRCTFCCLEPGRQGTHVRSTRNSVAESLSVLLTTLSLPQGYGWKRAGFDIAYFSSQVKRKNGIRGYFTLTFSFRCHYDNDLLYVCHSYPYTYTGERSHIPASYLQR